ncbi:response regulator transcription factor [Megasphaera vaginalis (ex Bordigoni et al. 2020)]|uniref:response regulator transcription factor n=1 Tax=Megasphaera vaginalis (ex Bordigoni et al. 2020) TaxID=2045301 RepID=UPI00278BEE74|nr:response regulator transcription factor [Megasphaera vaginalis (ex Bordigoni et al. 2020)]
MTMKILLAEDERDMAAAVAAVLTHSGYAVDTVYDGAAAVAKAAENVYDCLVFDVMMPHLDGIGALRQIRGSGNVTPVLLLTAKAEVGDRIDGLDAGADDYLTKPFAMGELLARLRSLTRRSGSFTPRLLTLGNVTLNVEEQELQGDNSIRLANKETKLMQLLLLNGGKDFSTEQLFARIWDDETDVTADIVWVYISYLRQKLEAIAATVEIVGEKNGSFVLREM